MTNTAEKKCPFCGEMIKAEAIKCRFCGEFLEIPLGGSLSSAEQVRQTPTGHSLGVDTEVIFEGNVSAFALVGLIVSTIIWLALVILLWFQGNAVVKNADIRQVITLASIILIFVVLLRFLFKWLGWKTKRFLITNDRIEIEHGVLKKSVQNMDMWRVQDLSFKQSLFQRIFGHGQIIIMSSDKDTPLIKIGPIYQARSYYDTLKRVQLEADRRRGVVHVEQ